MLLDKQSPFEKTTKQYDKVVAGYFTMFGSHEQLCTDLLAKLRESTATKCNLALLKYATESNCKWMAKIGITPTTYATSQLNPKHDPKGQSTRASLKKD